MQILQSEADLAEKQNILRNTMISMEQERLALRQEKLQLDLEVSRLKRTYQQNENLYNDNLLAREEYLRAKEDYELAVRKRDLVLERQKQDSLYRTSQVSQMEESLRSMQLNIVLAAAIAHAIRPQQRYEVEKAEGKRNWTKDMWEDYNAADEATRAMLRERWK